jgi:CRP-like cAMP-binding protein
VKRAGDRSFNRLLAGLKPHDLSLLSSALEDVTLASGDVLFEADQDVDYIHFPQKGAIAGLVLKLRDGSSAESAMIGWEGAIGGVISEGNKPAFTRGIVQIGGSAKRLHTDALEGAKRKSATLRDHFARYADCLLAQVLQSVACNAVHGFDARLARWLLSVQDRTGSAELHVTQEFMSEMLGVRRPYITRIVGELERQGAIKRGRGQITIVHRGKLEHQACECYAYLRRHYDRLLPQVYPS